MRVLTGADVERALDMSEAVEVARRALCDLSCGWAEVPRRLSVGVDEHAGDVLLMPAYLRAQNALGVKVLTLFDKNQERDLPHIHGVMMVLDPKTGRPLGLLEASHMTALRTGASSGVATDMLARQNASTALIFGAGPQAQAQLRGICAVRKLVRCLVYDVAAGRLAAFVEQMQEALPGVEIIPAKSATEAVRQADIICTATTSATPVFDGADLRAGTHINSIGSYKPDKREVDSTTLRRATKVVVDVRAEALAEAGDLLLAINDGAFSASAIYAEIGEIVAGRKVGRERDDEITFYKAVGTAALDVAVSAAIYERAVRLGLGTEVDLANAQDAKEGL